MPGDAPEETSGPALKQSKATREVFYDPRDCQSHQAKPPMATAMTA